MKPTVRQLEYAVAVAEHLSFQNAAAACHVTQPGLSAQVRQLEESLGVRLFDRDRRGVLITPEGERILAHARSILAEVDGLVESAREVAEPLSGRLRMGVIPTVAPYVLPSVLPAARSRYPKLRLVLREQQTEALLAMLEEGRLDVLLLALEAKLERFGRVEQLALRKDEFVLVTARDHPLARRKRVREQDLAGERVLLLEDGHCLRDQALAICSMVGVDEAADLRATSLGTLTQMVANGLGVTLLPRSSLTVEAGSRADVATVELALPRPYRTIGLVWRAGSSHAADYAALGDVFQRAWPVAARAG